MRKAVQRRATMARHPRLLKRFTVFTGTFLTHSTLPPRNQLIELLFVVGYYRMVSCYVNTVHVEREPGVPPIPAVKSADQTTLGDHPKSGVTWPQEP